jgi:phage tail-like protein
MAIASDSKLGMSMRFLVKIDNFADLDAWSKASGLEVSWDIAEYRAGDHDNERWIFPGFNKYKSVTLERAAEAASTAKVRDWLNSNSFKHEIQSATIELQDSSLKTVATWTLRRVLPVKWTLSTLDAAGNKIAVETLELAHIGFLDEAKA